MAAVLIRWKSRLLLPRKAKRAEPDPMAKPDLEEQRREEELLQDLTQQLLERPS